MAARLCIGATLLAATCLAGTVLAGAGSAVKLVTAQSKPYGTYVVDSSGRALYMFTADKRGEGSTAATSNCYDACAKAWPPLLAQANPEVGANLQPRLLGTMQRRDGARQVTYGGWPLYYFVRDKGPGSATGQDVHGFGGEWYLVAPGGSKIEKPKK